MVENGYLDPKSADALKEKDIPTPLDKRAYTEAPSVVGDVFKEIGKYGFDTDRIFNGDLFVHTTINLEIQKIANTALENGLAEFEKRHPEGKNLIQGAVVILRNKDAAILAVVGGRQIFNGKTISYTDFNRAKHAKRQPGSAFKPFVYLAALTNSFWSLDDKVEDRPISVSMGWGKLP